jgi:hypothetical protein
VAVHINHGIATVPVQSFDNPSTEFVMSLSDAEVKYIYLSRIIRAVENYSLTSDSQRPDSQLPCRSDQ